MEPENLRRVPLFAKLARRRLEELASGLPIREVVAGEVVARAGRSADHLVVVESGSLTAVHDTRDGTRVRLSTVTGPCLIDKVATLDAGVHTATWTAVTSCRITRLSGALLRRLVDEDQELRDHVVRYLSGEAAKQRRARVRSAASGPVAQVADWLAETARTSGRTVHLPGGQQGLGEELGLSRITVNRALQSLVSAGAISVRRGRVCVVNVQQLVVVSRT